MNHFVSVCLLSCQKRNLKLYSKESLKNTFSQKTTLEQFVVFRTEQGLRRETGDVTSGLKVILKFRFWLHYVHIFTFLCLFLFPLSSRGTIIEMFYFNSLQVNVLHIK